MKKYLLKICSVFVAISLFLIFLISCTSKETVLTNYNKGVFDLTFKTDSISETANITSNGALFNKIVV